MTAYIWGVENLDIFGPLMTSPQGKVFIHKKSRVIHIPDAWERTDGGIPFHQMWLLFFTGSGKSRRKVENQSTNNGSGSPKTGKGLLT